VGLSADGRTLAMIAVDGRAQASVGLTLALLGRLVVDLGYPQAVGLDGGGSTQMVRRPGGGTLAVANTPSDTPLRRVRDGVGVVPARERMAEMSQPLEHGGGGHGCIGRPDRAPCAPGSH
jgi:exopolysaccharide biosynthesis protein